jgi:hypothetical protein
MKPEYPNARIWIYENGSPVKLTLRPGQTRRWHHYAQDEEGYSSTRNEWDWDGRRLVNTLNFSGRDCDGRISRSGRCYTTPATFKTGFADPDHPGVTFPEWEELDATQRDYTAEARGY